MERSFYDLELSALSTPCEPIAPGPTIRSQRKQALEGEGLRVLGFKGGLLSAPIALVPLLTSLPPPSTVSPS